MLKYYLISWVLIISLRLTSLALSNQKCLYININADVSQGISKISEGM